MLGRGARTPHNAAAQLVAAAEQQECRAARALHHLLIKCEQGAT